MADLSNEIAEKLVEGADKENIVFTRSDKSDNMMQLIFEERITPQEIGEAVLNNAPEEEQKKIIVFYANDLIKYLIAKQTKTKLSGFRGQPVKIGEEPKKKISKSEQYLERRKKEKEAKERDQKKSDGKVEKISLKEVGQQMREDVEKQKEIDNKIKESQDTTAEEQRKHVCAYQTAFDLFAVSVENTVGKKKDTSEICELIKKMGSSEITGRQVALDKISKKPDSIFAIDALIAGLKDKNITINIINVLNNIGDRRAVVPMINLIREYPTPNDIIFRGPSERAIGEIVRRMNEKVKNSGTKLIYQVAVNPSFEAKLRVLIKVINRDLTNNKIRKEYFTPQCIKWLSLVMEKVYESKKKKVKIGFVNVTVQTDLSKEIRVFLDGLKSG